MPPRLSTRLLLHSFSSRAQVNDYPQALKSRPFGLKSEQTLAFGFIPGFH